MTVARTMRLPIIDAARGFAALLVCAFHARETIWVGLHSSVSQRIHDNIILTILGILSAPLYYGAVAVPLFFVISGYCIHRSFVSSLRARPELGLNWSGYFIRRAWRIYPVLIGVIVITFVLDQYTLHHFPEDTKLGSLSFSTMLVNVFALQGLAGPSFGSNGSLWSLSIEIQLYIVYPLFFILLQRIGMNKSLLVILFVSTASLALTFLPGLGKYMWFGSYWFCWILGCAVRELETGEPSVAFKPYQYIIWLLISVVGFWLWHGPFQTFAFSCVGCFWALLILKCLQRPVGSKPPLPLALIAKLGLISYSLYAVHEPVCLFIRSLFFNGIQTRNILYVLPVIAACIVVAWILFLLVERYSLRIPNWLRND